MQGFLAVLVLIRHSLIIFSDADFSSYRGSVWCPSLTKQSVHLFFSRGAALPVTAP